MEDAAAHGASQNENANPQKMTVNELSAWLTEHGKEEVVWNLKQKKAKKGEFVNAVLAAQS